MYGPRGSVLNPGQDADLAALDSVRQEAPARGELGRGGLGRGLLLALVQRHGRALRVAVGVAGAGKRGNRRAGGHSSSSSCRASYVSQTALAAAFTATHYSQLYR